MLEVFLRICGERAILLQVGQGLIDLVHEFVIFLAHDQGHAFDKDLFAGHDAGVGVLAERFQNGEFVRDPCIDFLGFECRKGFRIGLVGLDFLDAGNLLGRIKVASC